MQNRILSTQYVELYRSINCGTDRVPEQRIIDRLDTGLHWYVKHASVRRDRRWRLGPDIDQRGAAGVGPEQL